MPNEKTDKQGFNTNENDRERTLASQDGPVTGLGNPHNRSASTPAGDATTSLAALSTDKKNKTPEEENKEQPSHLQSNEEPASGD